MLSGGFYLGRVLGFPVEVGYTAVLVFLWIAWSMGHGQIANAVALSLIMFGSILVHELGHAVIGRRLGLQPRRIVLHGFGGLCQYGVSPNARQGVLSSAAGPGAGLLLGVVSWLVLHFAGPMLPSQAVWALDWLVWVNVFWSLFNLLPMYPLDGGHVLWHGLRLFLVGGRAWKITRVVGLVVAVLTVAVGYFTGMWFLALVAVLAGLDLINKP